MQALPEIFGACINRFIAVDFETAMYSPNSAVSIGMAKYHDYCLVDTFYSLIRPPKMYIRPDFTAIHGLTVDDVIDAPDFGCLWENGIGAFIEKLPLAAHNAPFDMGVLRATLEHYSIAPPKNKFFCSLALARKTWPQFPSRSLSNLAKHFCIEYEAHNALADAQVCGKIIELCAACHSDAAGLDQAMGIKELLKKTGVRMKGL